MTQNEVDVVSLRQRFENRQCHGVVALIDYLASPAGESIHSIGSSTIGLNEIMNEIWVSEEAQMAAAWFRTRSLHIGSKDGSVTPLQWLEKLSETYELLSAHAQTRFDEFCRACADIVQAKPVGHVEIFARGGIFRVPVEAHRDDMSDQDLEPYRVERSMLDGD